MNMNIENVVSYRTTNVQTKLMHAELLVAYAIRYSLSCSYV
jgi:hypothetical protein